MYKTSIIWDTQKYVIALLDCVTVESNRVSPTHKIPTNTHISYCWGGGSLPHNWDSFKVISWSEFQKIYGVSIKDLL